MLRPTVNYLNAEHAAYLHERMEAVSRSFALVVPVLESPFNHYMATAYLLCRVVDNIEDCTQTDAWRFQRFEEFIRLLDEPINAQEIVTSWERRRWPGLTEDEQAMMTVSGGIMLWQIYAGLPEAARQTMRRWTATMARGMRDINDPADSPRLVDHGDNQILETVADYNQYCFVVAGTVGHMATELAAQHYSLNDDISGSLIDDCEACGRALQKTNIVKDFAKDLERGVSFLPGEWMAQVDYAPLKLEGAPSEWTKMVLADLLMELKVGANYAISLPYRARGYRMAALLCLLPAYETIALAAKRHRQLFTAEHQVKISRIQMAQCKRRAKSMLTDNDAIVRYSRRMDESILSQFA